MTVLMLLLSARAGALAQRIGPRLPMTVGPLVVAAGLLGLSPGRARRRLRRPPCCPAAIVFGLGLALTVAPLTATVLAAVDDRHLGVASGVNNAVARASPGCSRSPCCRRWPASTSSSGARQLRRRLPHRPAAWLPAVCAPAGSVAWLTIRRATPVPANTVSLAQPCIDPCVEPVVAPASSAGHVQRRAR